MDQKNTGLLRDGYSGDRKMSIRLMPPYSSGISKEMVVSLSFCLRD